MADARSSEIAALHAAARRLGARAKRRGRLPVLFFITDPGRTPDPAVIANLLPRGAGVIFRAFGAADAVAVGRRLRAIASRRGLILLAGADERLARAVGADGVHLPERLARQAGAIARRHPRWIVTAATHGPAAVQVAARAGAHAALLSPVFESASPSAGRPLGATRFAALAHRSSIPVIALGGVTQGTARRLQGSGAAGIAAVDAFVLPERGKART